MDFGAKTIREAQFREKMRGYSPEDVDTFLEQVARGVEVLEERNYELSERARQLEQDLAQAKGAKDSKATPPSKSTGNAESNQELLEIFVLAKRTADDLVAKAETGSAEMLAGAKRTADEIAFGAQKDAETARQTEMARLNLDIEREQARHDALREEVARLGAVASDARAKVRTSLTLALESLEQSFADLYDGGSEQDLSPTQEREDDIFADVDDE